MKFSKKIHNSWFEYFDDMLVNTGSLIDALHYYDMEKKAGIKFDLYKDTNWTHALDKFHSSAAVKFNISKIEFAIKLAEKKLIRKGFVVRFENNKVFVFCHESLNQREPNLPFPIPQEAKKERLQTSKGFISGYSFDAELLPTLLDIQIPKHI
jgi:hypothetical protein